MKKKREKGLNLIEINIETIADLKPWEKAQVIRNRHIWLKQERKNNKLEFRRLENRIARFNKRIQAKRKKQK